MDETKPLNRKITVQRGYQIAPYQVLTITDTMDIPEEVAKNPEKLDAISQLMLTNLDNIYFKYMETSPTVK